jgi:hypothetical protein
MPTGKYVAPPSFQLAYYAGPTGPYDCTAHAAKVAAEAVTSGDWALTGRAIRQASSEPEPDPRSPGLNLPQVAAVLERRGIDTAVYIGSRALSWDEYELKRKAGRPAILQVGYAPISDSRYDAGRSRFRANHAIAETVHATYDPLAGPTSRTGIWHHDGRVYPRALMRGAASRLDIGGRLAGSAVWCLFLDDVVPKYLVTIKPPAGQRSRTFRTWNIVNGVIVGYDIDRTGGFQAEGRIRCVPWPAQKTSRYVIELTNGSRKGEFVNAEHGRPM